MAERFAAEDKGQTGVVTFISGRIILPCGHQAIQVFRKRSGPVKIIHDQNQQNCDLVNLLCLLCFLNFTF